MAEYNGFLASGDWAALSMEAVAASISSAERSGQGLLCSATVGIV
jgi:hypothetical protein